MIQSPLRAPWLQTITQVFADSPVYTVGGAVRNTLMGLPVSDVDLCGPARPDAVVKYCEGTPVTARLRAAHFGTVELHVGGHMAEYTTFRQDSYRTGHQPVAVRFADTVAVDALRRDFSVNALYTPLRDPAQIIDPTGGLQHLRDKILHTVTEDPDQVLKDDGLRILRAVRFQAELGFTLSQAVRTSAGKYVDLLDDIAAERKRDELTKLLLADIKYPMLNRTTHPVVRGLDTLVAIGAWPKLFGALQPVDFSAFHHAEQLEPGFKLALLYYQEKPTELAERMLAMRYAKNDAKAAADALTVLQSARDIQAKPSTLLHFGLSALQNTKKMLVLLAGVNSDYRQVAAYVDSLLKKVTQGQIPAGLKELAIHGDDLLVLCRARQYPQERMGAVLQMLWKEVVNGRVPNTRQALLRQAEMHWIDSVVRE